MRSRFPNSNVTIVPHDDQSGVIVVVDIFKQFIHSLVIAIGLEQNAVPEEFITDMELDSELYYFTHIVTLID